MRPSNASSMIRTPSRAASRTGFGACLRSSRCRPTTRIYWREQLRGGVVIDYATIFCQDIRGMHSKRLKSHLEGPLADRPPAWMGVRVPSTCVDGQRNAPYDAISIAPPYVWLAQSL